MSLERGKFGIEWNPRQDAHRASGWGWLFVLVGVVALVSLSVTLVRRWRAAADGASPEGEQEPPSAASASGGLPEAVAAVPADADATNPAPAVVVPPDVRQAMTEKRPVRVHNLLLKLEEAERRRDVDMAAARIEQILAMPGSPAADLEDALARRLGTLNVRRLFVRKTPLWVRQVEVRRGDTASRIASENGSTFASLVRLNGGDVDRIRVGQKLYVMDHPRFRLVIHRRARTADLWLKDKFFKRYDLTQEPTAEKGAHELPRGTSAFWKSLGVSFKVPGQAELDLLMPVGSSVLISET